MRDELHHHIDAGMQVSRLAVEWSERLRCVLGDDLGVRRLRFTDLVMQEAGDVEADDAAARFDADFALMSAELASFIPRLIEVFGGEDGG
jgi:recombination associated protein RdgC